MSPHYLQGGVQREQYAAVQRDFEPPSTFGKFTGIQGTPHVFQFALRQDFYGQSGDAGAGRAGPHGRQRAASDVRLRKPVPKARRRS